MMAAADACPVGIFLNADDPLACLLVQVRRLADEAGALAYLVGGPVRDNLLGCPTKDLDISVVGDAPALAARLADAAGGRLTVHQRFGTATVETAGGTVDLVTARRETYPLPGSLPEVSPGGIADDLARRDFTINAMAIPLADQRRELIDPHGGRADLRAGVIRILHETSFIDDPTRTLRAARYASRFGFGIADDTMAALHDALPAAMFTISGDRVRRELERIFQEDRPAPALRLAANLGILASIHPGLSADGLADFVSAAIVSRPLVWLSAVAWTLSDEAGAAFSARINAPSDWARVIEDTAILSARLGRLIERETPPSMVCELLDGLAPDALYAARSLAPEMASQRIGSYLDEWWSMAPLLRGSDLLELGVPPGPAIGEVLRALRRARLDGEIHSRQDEELIARRWVSPSR